MKKFYQLSITATAFLFLTLSSAAQPGCPAVDAGNDTTISCGTCTVLKAKTINSGSTSSYAVSSIPFNPPFQFNTGTQLFIGIDDIWSDVIPLPFTFCFFGNTYNQIVVGTNGLITFDVSAANTYCEWSYTASLPSPVLQTNTIFGAYHDIDPAVCGEIRYAVSGNAPCRTFVVSYNQVCHFSCNNLLTTQQIVFYETTNAVEVYIQSKPTCNNWNFGNAVIGIQNATGTVAYTPPGRNTGPWSTTNEAWRFTPNGPGNYSIVWTQNGNVISTADTALVCPDMLTTYDVEVTYQNCDNTVVTLNDNVTIDVDTIGAPPEILLNNPICVGGTVQLNSQMPGGAHTWTGPANFQSTVYNPSINPADESHAGVYHVVVLDNQGCTHEGSIDVFINANPVAAITYTGPDCAGDVIVIEDASTLEGGTIASWGWDISGPSGFNLAESSQNTGFQDALPGNYTIGLIVVSDSGCADTTTLDITIHQNPVANFQTSAECFNKVIFMDSSYGGTGGYTYQWFLDDEPGADQALAFFEYIFPDSLEKNITLIVTDSLGCIGDTMKTIPVKGGVSLPDIPNVMALNSNFGNGKIDFEVFAPGFNLCIDYTFSIFNRWGIKVYEATNNVANPDLTCAGCFTGKNSNGVVLIPGVYFYVLQGSKGVDRNGSITIFENTP